MTARCLYSGSPLPQCPEREFLAHWVLLTLDDAVAISRGDAVHFDYNCKGRKPFKDHPEGAPEYHLRVLQLASRDLFVWLNSEEWRGLCTILGFSDIDTLTQTVFEIARGWRKREARRIRDYLYPKKRGEDAKEETVAREG